MDYISVSSEIIESWDFTQTPVRGLREVYGERSIDDIFQYSDIIWSKGVRKKLSRRKEPFRHRKIVESSTSLILKKTIDRKVVNDYSASSFSDIILPHNPVYGDSDDKYPTAADGKPLIKVTVIPHSQPHQYDEGYRPHRNITIPQKPIPKPDHPYDTKNFYLVVAGCKNRKIYELNTRSGKGETCKHEALLNENEYKEYFKANMIKNKRKLTTKNDNLASEEELTETCTHNCNCHGCRRRSSQDLKPKTNGNTRNGSKIKKNKGRNDLEGFRVEIPSTASRTSGSNRSRTDIAITRKGVANVSSPKSRIKITGRLGLTAEDKYVLKCDATLNDKPIATHFQTTGHDTEPRRPSDCPLTATTETQRSHLDLCYRPPKTQRDTSIQADARFIPCPAFEPPPKKQRDSNIQTDIRFTPCPIPEATFQCQATQISLDPPRPNRTVFNDDKIVQCRCATTVDNSTYTTDDSEDISLKPCPSPIVIISVYPNQDSTDIVTKNKGSSMEDKYTTQIEYAQKGKQRIGNKTKIAKVAGRSRSPSPAKATKKDKETQIKSTVTSSKQLCDSISNPGRKKTKSSNVQTVNQMKTTITSKKSEQRSKSPTRNPSPGRRKENLKTKPNSNLSTGTNTDQLLTKKALVDDFTKQIALMNEKKAELGLMWRAKRNVSNVTVNIDGDKERYNVTFHQGDLDTDLSVKKTNKGVMTNHPRVEEHTFVENFLYLRPDEPRKRSHSQTHLMEGNNPVDSRSSSNIKVVDSLEISHRREDRTPIVGKTTQTTVNNDKDTCNEVDNKFLAPIKHFHGDECSITDPIERDLEIRALLGIEKGRFKPPERSSSSKACDPLGVGSGVSLHYLYQPPHPSKSEAKKSRPKNKILVSDKVKQDAMFAPEKKASLYQQLVLSKNFQVLLELKQSKKEKPIVLTHQQYEKVRKNICHVLVKNNSVSRHTKMCSLKCSVVSLGKIRPKLKENIVYHYNKEAQTEVVGVSVSMIQTDNILGKQDFDLSSKADNEEVLKLINDFTKRDDSSSSNVSEPTRKSVEVKESTDDSKQIKLECRESALSAHHAAHTNTKSLSILEKTETRILINSSQSTYHLKSKPNKASVETEYPKRAASSLEVHYASTSYIRHVKFSSSDIVRNSNSVTKNLEAKESASIHTLFNGHRRTYTPNLGASAYSLCADGASDCFDTRFQYFDDSNLNLKPKKPFLRRLISCLVLRTSRASNTKFLPGPVLNKPSIDSLDSYHINTSLGAVEMSSSIYDTTASFYSNHTILPARRMRRGFFCSVRGFLSRS